MIAGGTGINPFCDLIDLLFKEQIVKDKPFLASEVYGLCPVLSTSPFSGFSFHLLAAFNSLDDIHPITLRQIVFLVSKGRLIFQLKLRETIETCVLLKNVQLIDECFTDLLEKVLRNGPVSKVWICGPPKMSESIGKFMKEKD